LIKFSEDRRDIKIVSINNWNERIELVFNKYIDVNDEQDHFHSLIGLVKIA
jgi:hypothetical protein